MPRLKRSVRRAEARRTRQPLGRASRTRATVQNLTEPTLPVARDCNPGCSATPSGRRSPVWTGCWTTPPPDKTADAAGGDYAVQDSGAGHGGDLFFGLSPGGFRSRPERAVADGSLPADRARPGCRQAPARRHPPAPAAAARGRQRFPRLGSVCLAGGTNGGSVTDPQRHPRE